MKVLIVGAGPAGLLMANYLIRRQGYDVHIVERRSDPRRIAMPSYPIAMQQRGLQALRQVPGLESLIESQGIRPAGVCFHRDKNKVQKIPLDPPKLFVDHGQMTLTLLENLMKSDMPKDTSLSIDFDCSVHDMDLDKKTISVVGTTTTMKADEKKSISFDQLVAADGGKSKIRHELMAMGELNAEQKDIPDEYRTIVLSPGQLDTNWIHAWMPNGIRVMAACLNDDDRLLRGALIFDKNQDPFLTMKSPNEVQDYFEKLSPMLAKLITLDEAKQILKRPTVSLVAVHCDSLHVRDCVLLLGDAAHAVSQSVGHGCISAFQDVQVFDTLLDKYHDDWTRALSAYSNTRLDDAHALNELEYSTPRTKLLKLEWILRQLLKKVFGRFMRPLPTDLLSDTTLSYREVLEQSRWWIERVKKSSKK